MKLTYSNHTLFCVLLGISVVMLGAYTRLSDAGLGCPDWPGCYGNIIVPSSKQSVIEAHQAFPNAMPVTPYKAWLEMLHRYLAGSLVLVVLAMIYRHYKKHSTIPNRLWFIPGLMFLQAAFGMWTVTWKLHPLAVMPHLAGGMTLVSLLWWHRLSCQKHSKRKIAYGFWALLFLICLQILLGGWTSSNYAALICADFPYCKGSLWPQMNFYEAFNVMNLPVGLNYEGGLMSTAARVSIQMTHRFMASIVFISVFASMIWLMIKHHQHRNQSLIIISLLFIQVILGITNVLASLPIWSATLHNTVALLLVLSLLSLIHQIQYEPSK